MIYCFGVYCTVLGRTVLFWGVLPDRSKYEVTKPPHTNDGSCEVSNCRPASPLTSFPKIFEMVKQIRILKHFTKHNTLSTEQCGFKTGLKTDNATCKLTNEILNATNNELIVRGIFCDLEKALFISCYLNWNSMTRILHFIIPIWIGDIAEQRYTCTVTEMAVTQLQAGFK